MKMGLHSLSWKGIGIDVQSQPAEFVSLQDKNMEKQKLSIFSFELDQKKGFFPSARVCLHPAAAIGEHDRGLVDPINYFCCFQP